MAPNSYRLLLTASIALVLFIHSGCAQKDTVVKELGEASQNVMGEVDKVNNAAQAVQEGYTTTKTTLENAAQNGAAAYDATKNVVDSVNKAVDATQKAQDAYNSLEQSLQPLSQ